MMNISGKLSSESSDVLQIAAFVLYQLETSIFIYELCTVSAFNKFNQCFIIFWQKTPLTDQLIE